MEMDIYDNDVQVTSAKLEEKRHEIINDIISQASEYKIKSPHLSFYDLANNIATDVFISHLCLKIDELEARILLLEGSGKA